jgi:trans-aconitate methyltransferase
MTEYGESTYGDEIAEIYDQLYSEVDPACIDFLAEAAGPGPALELGIGTGRIALPLVQRGVALEGIDASEAMVARLRTKEGGADIPVKMGSFERFTLDRRFRLIYVVFNTFFGLPGQDAQLQCFHCVASHLSPDGRFAIEAFVPDLARYDRFQSVRLIGVSGQTVQMDVAQLDPVAQHIESRHVFVSEDGIRIFPVRLRYAYPPELDLMALNAGLKLEARWGSWSKEPFTRDSGKHISVYGRAG